ncbi:MAG: LacI family DNA-binding transcriptional regulator [Pseudomonadota bacterium]
MASGKGGGRSRVTADDVAREAGVSISAVSRVFTPGASASSKMRAKVLAASERLDYMPNAMARSLMTNRTNLIGIIMANFKNPVYLSILDSFTHAIQQRGLRSLLFNVSHGDDLEGSVRQIMEYSIDGLIVSAASMSPLLSEQCRRRDIPLVVFARHPRNVKANVVTADNIAGGRMAARLLIERGYRRMAYIGGPETISTSRDRGLGFDQALEEAGLAPAMRVNAADYGYDEGHEAVDRLFAGGDRPEAIFCVNDILAMGVMDALRYDFGLKIPDDIAVVGFDDIHLAGTKPYQLTTIRQPIDAMVRESIDILTDQPGKGDEAPVTRMLPCTVVERGTVRKSGTT